MAADAGSHKIPETEPVRVYTEGDELYKDMLAAIRGARRCVKFESYIFAHDEIGLRFIEALVERARAGVQVLVYIDAVGSWFAGHAVEQALRAGGVKVRRFHRWNWRNLARFNRRNHRKLLVVDGRIGFLGGFNIHRDSSLSVFGERRWRDTHIRVDGALARGLQELFDAFWRRKRRLEPHLEVPGGHLLITNHSHRSRDRLHRLYGEKFGGAKQYIHLTTPYFVPDHRTRRWLMRAALRGVEVRLLVPRKSDTRVVQWAAHAAYANLLAAGVQINEYLPRMLHAKTVVVDGTWCTVGTSNLDYRSFFLNYELTLASTDPALVTRLEEDFQSDMKLSVHIQAKRWARRRWWLRSLEAIGWWARHWL